MRERWARSAVRGTDEVRRRLAAAAAQLVSLPLRDVALVAAVHALVVLAVGAATVRLVDGAIVSAGLTGVTDRDLGRLLHAPASVALLAVAAAAVAVVTLAWAVLVLVIADERIAGATPSVRRVLRRSGRALALLARPSGLLLAAQAALLAPLVGIPLFAPLTSALSLPPFIGREFLKAPLSSSLWLAAAGLVLFVVARTALALPFVVVRGDRPVTALRASVAVTASPASGLAAIGLAGAVAAVVSLGSQLVPVSAGRSAALAAAGGAATIVGALGIALALVGSTRAAAGAVNGRAGTVADRSRAATDEAARRGTPAVRTRAAVAALAATAVLALAGTALTAPPPASAGARNEPSLVIGHRGNDTGGVENTIGGLEAAAALGVDVVEVDVQQDADGTLVATHDTNLLVLAGIDRDIWEMPTSEVVSTVVTANGHSDTIPTMAAFARRAHALGVPLLVELKVHGHERGDVVTDMLEQLESAAPLDGTTFHSLDPDAVREVERERPDIPTGLTIAMMRGELPRAGADFYVVEQASLTPATIREAHRRGARIFAWTVNDADVMRDLVRAGVDGLVTDAPRIAAEVVDGR